MACPLSLIISFLLQNFRWLVTTDVMSAKYTIAGRLICSVARPEHHRAVRDNRLNLSIPCLCFSPPHPQPYLGAFSTLPSYLSVRSHCSHPDPAFIYPAIRSLIPQMLNACPVTGSATGPGNTVMSQNRHDSCPKGADILEEANSSSVNNHKDEWIILPGTDVTKGSMHNAGRVSDKAFDRNRNTRHDFSRHITFKPKSEGWGAG